MNSNRNQNGMDRYAENLRMQHSSRYIVGPRGSLGEVNSDLALNAPISSPRLAIRPRLNLR